MHMHFFRFFCKNQFGLLWLSTCVYLKVYTNFENLFTHNFKNLRSTTLILDSNTKLYLWVCRSITDILLIFSPKVVFIAPKVDYSNFLLSDKPTII